MARMPTARWVGPYHDNGKMTQYHIVCLHTIGFGSAPAHQAQFSVAGDGTIYQSRDTLYQSAANYQGNPRIIAIENADYDSTFRWWDKNDGHAVPPFTPAQIESNAQICAWNYHTHGIPLVACPDSKPGSKGIAYHRQGIDGNWADYAYAGRVSGGETWTKYRGKVCPGDRRISQVPQIIARARVLAGLDRKDDMKLLGQQPNSDKVWLGDFMYRRHVEDPVELQGLQFWLQQTGGDPTIHQIQDIRVLGIDVATLTEPPPV